MAVVSSQPGYIIEAEAPVQAGHADIAIHQQDMFFDILRNADRQIRGYK